MAAILSAALVSGSIGPGMGITAGAAVPGRMIEAFEELSEETLFQAVPLGTKKRELKLPNYLNAKLEAEEGSGEDGWDGEDGGNAATPSQAAATGSEADKAGTWRKVKVTWVLDEDFSEQETYDGQVPGIYVFEAELASDRYELSGAELPAIEVEVLVEAEEDGQEATPSDAPEGIPEEILVTDWTYLDDGNLSDDGSLTLYESTYGFDEVVSLLPGRIQAVVEEDGTTKTLLLTWDSPDYRAEQEEREEAGEREEAEEREESGAQAESEEQTAGSYRFRWELPEGYVLSEDAKEPELTVISDTGELSLEQQAQILETQIERQRYLRKGSAPASSYRFLIGSEAVLRELAEKVNGGETWADGDISYGENTYVLTENIRLTDEWIPVGTESHPFAGTFDGDGFVIGGLTIDDPDMEDCGLFGYVKGGTVEDLGLKEVEIRGGTRVGAVAGTLYEGILRRCYSTGSISAESLAGYSVPGQILLTGIAGGLAGVADTGSIVKDCYSSIELEAHTAGGITGILADSSMENCYSTGKITLNTETEAKYALMGGMAGFLSYGRKPAKLSNTIALNPSLDSMDKGYPKRIYCRGIKINQEGQEGANLIFQNNYAFSGMKINMSSIPGSSPDIHDGEDFTYHAANGIFSTPWEDIFSDTSAWDIKPYSLPVLKDIGGQCGEIPYWLAEGTEAYLYIGSEEELAAFRDRVNGTDGSPADAFTGKTVRLTADIRLTKEWEPIGVYLGANDPDNCPFKGILDGDGHIISGVSITQNTENESISGLFGYVAGGTIENLGVKDADIHGKYCGAVVGFLDGGEIRACYSTGKVNSGVIAGGIVGAAEANGDDDCTVKDCYSLADVSANEPDGFAGGIVGRSVIDNTTISNIMRCYSTGSASGSSIKCGGLAGMVQGSISLTNSAALNKSLSQRDGGRVYGAATRSSGSHPVTKNNYAFYGMELDGGTVPAGTGTTTNKHGADLTYNPSTQEFNVSWKHIFVDTGAWDITPGKLPTLKGLRGQDGTIPQYIWTREEPEVLEIGSEAELAAFRDKVNGGDDFAGRTVKLTKDIRLTGEWTPIGVYAGDAQPKDNRPFKGTFEGNGYVISGMRFQSGMSYQELEDANAGDVGLFDLLEGTVRNLGLRDVDVVAYNIAGGIAAHMENAAIQNCFVEGTVMGYVAAGGIAGIMSDSTIKNSYFRGVVTWTEPNAGVYGITGGIAGFLSSGKNELSHCYSAGSLGKRGDPGIAGGLVGAVDDANGGDPAGTVRRNAALNHSLEGTDRAVIGRIYSRSGTGSRVTFAENYAYKGMKAGGSTAAGDDGTGLNGMDGTAAELVMNRSLFPESDWTLMEGCFPVLSVFAGEEPVPFAGWLEEQAEERFGMELEAPLSFTFPAAEVGYETPAGKTVAVKNTGTAATGDLAVTLTEQKKDGVGKGQGEADYFILPKAAVDSIAAGEAGEFVIAPAKGLPAGSYTAAVKVAGNFGLSGTYDVSFTVNPASRPGRSDGGSDRTPEKPPYTILIGDVPSSVGTGTWERQPDGGWKFYRVQENAAGSGPGLASGGTVRPAVKEWLWIDGFWYLFDENGRMVSGWASVNGVWYYLSTAGHSAANPPYKEGAMVTGWVREQDSSLWYWMDENGAMATGWREIDGKRYYFNPGPEGTAGALRTDEQESGSVISNGRADDIFLWHP